MFSGFVNRSGVIKPRAPSDVSGHIDESGHEGNGIGHWEPKPQCRTLASLEGGAWPAPIPRSENIIFCISCDLFHVAGYAARGFAHSRRNRSSRLPCRRHLRHDAPRRVTVYPRDALTFEAMSSIPYATIEQCHRRRALRTLWTGVTEIT